MFVSIQYLYDNLKKEIEIYSINNSFDLLESIKLHEFDNKNIIFYSMNFNNDDNTYIITALELINDVFCSLLYILNNNGVILTKIILDDIDLTKSIIRKNNIYYLREEINMEHDLEPHDHMDSCSHVAKYKLMMYNINDNSIIIIDDSITNLLKNTDSIYYVKNEEQYESDIKPTLYQYDFKNNTKNIITELDENFIISSACIDYIKNLVYISDGYNIFSYSILDKKLNNILESLYSYVEILQIVDSNIIIRIGNNQISIYNTN